MAVLSVIVSALRDPQTFLHNVQNTTVRYLPPANEVSEGYVFTPVCHSVHRGVCASVHAGIHPQEADNPSPRKWVPSLPGSRYPQEADTLPGSRHPPVSRHPPQCSECWDIWATSRLYASYWNAYLLIV